MKVKDAIIILSKENKEADFVCYDFNDKKGSQIVTFCRYKDNGTDIIAPVTKKQIEEDFKVIEDKIAENIKNLI